MPSRPRPLGITILAILHGLAALFLFLVLGFVLGRMVPSTLQFIYLLVAGILCASIAVCVGIAHGLWHLKPSTYTVMIVLYGFVLTAQIVTIVRQLSFGWDWIPLRQWLPLLISAGIVTYLILPKTQACFAGASVAKSRAPH